MNTSFRARFGCPLFAIVVLLATAASGRQERGFPDCLNGSSTRHKFVPADHDECNQDVFSVAKDKYVLCANASQCLAVLRATASRPDC